MLAWSLYRLRQNVSAGPIIQLIGAAGVVIVGGAHVCEQFQLVPAMGWGEPHSVGHYVDLVSAVLAATLLPIAFVLTLSARARR